MNDITALMATMKAAAEKASNDDWVKESGDGWEATCSANDQANGGFIIAHFEGPDAAENREFVQAASPANVKTLVEALEKAQQESTAGAAGMAEGYETTISMLKSRIAELEKYAEAEATGADKAAESSVYWMKRYRELESRTGTVKLPERYDVETYPLQSPNGEWYARDDVLAMLLTAGIQVIEGEGQ